MEPTSRWRAATVDFKRKRRARGVRRRLLGDEGDDQDGDGDGDDDDEEDVELRRRTTRTNRGSRPSARHPSVPGLVLIRGSWRGFAVSQSPSPAAACGGWGFGSVGIARR